MLINKFKEAVAAWLIGEIPQPKYLQLQTSTILRPYLLMKRNSNQPEDTDGVILGETKPAKKVDVCPTYKD